MVGKRLVIGGLAVAALTLAVVPALADSQPYAGIDVVAQCQGAPLVGTGDPTIDAAQASPVSTTGCYQVPAGATAIDVAVTDDSGAAVPFEVSYQAPDGATSVGTNQFSCVAGEFTLPTDATTGAVTAGYVYVFIDDPSTANDKCGAPTVATTGTITTSWVTPVV